MSPISVRPRMRSTTVERARSNTVRRPPTMPALRTAIPRVLSRRSAWNAWRAKRLSYSSVCMSLCRTVWQCHCAQSAADFCHPQAHRRRAVE
eukprot:scaffold130545_cov114-Phaeocystis_antarctica.AAC.2